MTTLVDLSGMLADASVAGVYFIDAGDGRQVIADATKRLNFFQADIDLTGHAGKADVLDALARALQFPAWFGHNWDALGDSLNDLSWLPADGYVLLLDHAGQWRQADPEGFDILVEIGNDTARSWAAHGVAFWILILSPSDAIRTSQASAIQPS